MRKIHFVFFFFLSYITCFSFNTDTTKVFFIGNSHTYTKNLTQIIMKMAEERNIPLLIRKVANPGYTLNDHLTKNYKEIFKNKLIKDKYDLIVFQENSSFPHLFPDSSMNSFIMIKKLIDSLSMKSIVYRTWQKKSAPHFNENLNLYYEKISNLLKIPIIPFNKIWEKASSMRPELNLYDKDNHHAGFEGVYLNACVFFKIFTGESPVGLSNSYSTYDYMNESIQLIWITKEDAAFLQWIADKFTEDYFYKADL